MSLQEQLIISENDKRKYEIFKLQNDLECLIIQDEHTKISATSLSVQCGYLNDPQNIPGLAHFLEHMLFLGTEKYPNEDTYSTYISQNGGSSNAFTSDTQTNFYFTVKNNSLNHALDIFSQFFISPLFSENCIERELNAVDSEHQKNLNQDNWRFSHLFRISGLQGSTFNRFGTGSKETLSIPDIKDQIIKFYNKYYSSNLMKLVVLSNQNLDIIKEQIQQNFQLIQNKNLKVPIYKDLPFNQQNLSQQWTIVSLSKINVLEFLWVLPDQHINFKNHPILYISHFLGHEGENTPYQLLKELNLVHSLSCGPTNYQQLFTVFKVKLNLTQKGLKNISQIRNIIFQSIKYLKEKGIQKYFYDELQLINNLQFNTKSNENPSVYVQELSSRMHFYPQKYILKQPYLFEQM
ncbi:Metalloenzyme, LuxS/M16 peptidase-like protein [Pseudocohnilembus persalinus]|uniref:Metalloenzyme, LuxS/M16 peptidase-like protein n=1 Tax=Pseudocohnilembus persalinus TaxID=266149 RepID=A0A0V0QWW8_PSEPJ|nr:Metalloenzyme, LuxS/M16 peptidase-like protein [Pseudocohnilembus persalinus]|eukprot:KRX06860.1 Metalloenzyme, LuxS/M16 peptidase-like protein [Pseudocohnilembus persalinus]